MRILDMLCVGNWAKELARDVGEILERLWNVARLWNDSGNQVLFKNTCY